MLPFVRGFYVVLTKPKLWGYIWKPMALAAALYLALYLCAAKLILPQIAGFVQAGWLRSLAETGGGLALFAAWLFVANFAFLALSGLFSSLLWDPLSKRVEVEVFGDAPDGRVGCFVYLFDSAMRVIVAILVFALALVFGWLGVVIGAAACGFLSLVDFSACAYLRRGIAYPAQLRVLRAKNAISFMVCCGALSLVPFGFVLALPAMVAGATILCREAESNRSSPAEG